MRVPVRFDVPANAAEKACSTCGKAIVWILRAGKVSPVDVDSIREELDGVRRGTSHFATCPQADQHRKAWR